MDRTAWVVVILCVIGLVLWQTWVVRQSTTRPAAVSASPAPGESAPAISPSATAAPVITPAPVATPAPTPVAPTFALKTETLSNSDVELRFTNRGGGISEAVLAHHKAEHEKPVALNAPEYLPV